MRHAPVALCVVLAVACSTSAPTQIALLSDEGGARVDAGDGSHDDGGGDEAADSAAASACDHLFDVITSTRCGALEPPAAALAAMRPLYEQSCVARLRLPATSWTAASLEACATAGAASPCDATARPAACIVAAGSRPDGAACSDDAQCASTRCARTFGTTPGGGPATIPACGTCSPAGAAGEPCGAGVGDGCADGTACVASPKPVCASIHAGVEDDPCDGVARTCAPGLACDAALAVCRPLPTRGEPCASPDACQRPYACLLGQCADPRPPGSPCTASRDCAPGLVCAGWDGRGVRRVRKCVDPTWAAPGGACGDTAPCLVGSCSGDAATCPRVLPDGAACVAFDPAATCGPYSACMDGRCSPEYGVPCP